MSTARRGGVDDLILLSGSPGNNPGHYAGTADPSAGAGVAATEGSVYSRYAAGAGEIWQKTGALDTDWTLFPTAPFNPERTIIVSPTGGDEATVAAGVVAVNALVPAPDANNPAAIIVYPGIYNEDPFTIPEGVSLIGQGSATRVTPTTPTTALVTVEDGGTIQDIGIADVNGVGGIGLLFNDAGLATAHSVCFWNCTIACQVTGAGVVAQLCTIYISITGAQTGVQVAAGGTLDFFATKVQGDNTAGSVAMHATGAGSTLHALSTHSGEVEDGILLSNGAEVEVSGGMLHDCVHAKHVEATGGDLHSYALDIEDSSVYDLYIEAANGSYRGFGSAIQSDKISVAAGATYASAQLSDFEGDRSTMIVGELAVGMPNFPSESIFGEGDSHVRQMSVFRNTNLEAGAWSDITTEMASTSGSTAAAFPGVGIGNTLYIGGLEKEFPGAKIKTTAAIVLGAGSLVWEYWDGGSWTNFRLMTADSVAPYVSYAEDTFGRIAFEQVRFNPDDMTGWATKSLNGTSRYWVRCRIAGAITTSPTLEQIKLHTNRTEINSDGVVEYFGTAITEREVLWHKNLMETFTGGGTPANANQLLSANITIAAQTVVLANNGTDGLAGLFVLPEGLDTSRDISLRFLYILKTAGTGAAVEFQGHFAELELGDILDGSVGDTPWSEIINVNALATDELAQEETSFDVRTLVPGEFIAFSLYRDATGGNLDDTLNGNVQLVAVELHGYFWK